MTAALVPLKYVATVNDDKLDEATDPYYEFDYVDIGAVGRGRLIEAPERMCFQEAPSRARRLVQPGDTIISTVRTYLRAVWAVQGQTEHLVVSTGFAVVRPRSINARFLRWAIQSDSFIEAVVAASTGVSYPAINPGDLAALPISVPPTQAEQRRIADFLDAETARIDALITAKQQMVRLTEARSSSVLNRAFNVAHQRLRFDGVPVGVGHWPSTRLGSVASVQSGLTLDASRGFDSDTEWVPYLRVANVQDGHIDTTEVKRVRADARILARHLLQAGDVLMTEGGDPDKLGRGAVWDATVQPCLHQNHVFAVRPRPDILDPHFLALLTRTSYGRAYFEMTATKTTGIASTSASKIAGFRVPMPPIEEQQEIVRAITDSIASHRMVTATLTRQIELLRERRQALITAAVSGELAS